MKNTMETRLQSTGSRTGSERSTAFKSEHKSHKIVCTKEVSTVFQMTLQPMKKKSTNKNPLTQASPLHTIWCPQHLPSIIRGEPERLLSPPQCQCFHQLLRSNGRFRKNSGRQGEEVLRVGAVDGWMGLVQWGLHRCQHFQHFSWMMRLRW